MTEPRPHPCEWQPAALAVIAGLLDEHHAAGLGDIDDPVCADPLAGRGSITTCPTSAPWRFVGCELEPEWAAVCDAIDCADATRWLPAHAHDIDAIATSIPFGNRMADQYQPQPSDKSVRATYAISLGRRLIPHNAAAHAWGPIYRALTSRILAACCATDAGLVIVEAANPLIRRREIDVVSWAADELAACGRTVERIVWRTRQRRFTDTLASDVLLVAT